MKQRQQPDLRSSRKSVFYAYDPEAREDPSMRARSEIYTKLYPYMLIEDVRNGIQFAHRMPDKTDSKISLVPPDRNIERMIAKGLDREHRGLRLSDEAWEFIADCAANLTAFERSIYEIVYFSNPADNKTVEFGLAPIHPLTVTISRSMVKQHIPKSIAKKRNIPDTVALDPKTVLCFTLPSQYKGKLSNTINLLAAVSRDVIPDFYISDTGELKSEVPVDIEEIGYTRLLAVAEATRHIGWSARWAFQGRTLEYYQLFRMLEFETYKVSLRDEILRTLNQGLVRIGTVMGFSAQLAITGSPTVKDIDDSQKHLSDGDLSFKEVMAKY